MEQLKYAILGIVQGLTEFLPVSSSGHLAITQRLLGIGTDLGFDTAVHLGTALAVVIFYFKQLLSYAADLFSPLVGTKSKRDSIGGGRLVLLLALTSIPAALAGFFLQDRVEAAFSSPLAISAFLCVTGVILIIVSRGREGRVANSRGTMFSSALIIGIAQAVALLPGISRSGMTIAAALACGFAAQWAVDYSMMASLPVILGAFLFQAVDGQMAFSGGSLANTLIGMAASLATGLLAISVLKKLAGRRSFLPFAVWVFLVAALNAALYSIAGI